MRFQDLLRKAENCSLSRKKKQLFTESSSFCCSTRKLTNFKSFNFLQFFLNIIILVVGKTNYLRTLRKYPMLLNLPNIWRAIHLYHPLCSLRISLKLRNPFGFCMTGGSPSSFCQIGLAFGFESTSHFRETGIPSRIGNPKPGSRDMANDGVSEKQNNNCQKISNFTVIRSRIIIIVLLK